MDHTAMLCYYSPVRPRPNACDVVRAADEVLVLVPVVALRHDLLSLPALRQLGSDYGRGWDGSLSFCFT